MIAVKRLQSLIWIILVALGALGAYLVSLKVATERNELMRVRAQIARAQADIRYLETEFSARANMRLICCSLSPYHLDRRSELFIEMKFASASLATALASRVLPVPGGP